MSHTPTEPEWIAVPNLNGRKPAQEPPRDRVIKVRNLANRIPNSREMRISEHLAFFDHQAGHFVRFQEDASLDPVFVFFHLWRDI